MSRTSTEQSPMVNQLAKFAVVERWRKLCAEKGETPASQAFLLASWVDGEIERLKTVPSASQATLF